MWGVTAEEWCVPEIRISAPTQVGANIRGFLFQGCLAGNALSYLRKAVGKKKTYMHFYYFKYLLGTMEIFFFGEEKEIGCFYKQNVCWSACSAFFKEPFFFFCCGG